MPVNSFKDDEQHVEKINVKLSPAYSAICLPTKKKLLVYFS